MNVHTLSTYIIVIVALMFFCPPAAAIYAWEGIPVEPVIQGEMNGDILYFGTYGLESPPIDLRFTLPSEPVFARVYAGVWGGTQYYTGWADITVNNLQKARFQLEGDRDRNRNVYVSSHGSYWIAYDATGLLRSGSNLVTVETSRGEEGNRLDGRVYGVVVVVGIEDPASGRIQYWIAEGNENLHGEGWAGTNPTRKDSATTTFVGADMDGMRSAELYVAYTASNAGQPDYLVFNGHDLGIELPDGTRNIANERSFSATGGEGIPSRYMDVERFDVTGYLRETNEILFERGRDLDGDGQIATTGLFVEGNDYLHPVLAVLTLKKEGGATPPDLAVADISIFNAYAGEIATVTADIRNYGGVPGVKPTVIFRADGVVFAEKEIDIGHDGRSVVSVPWNPASGTIALTVSAEVSGDRNPDNNAISRSITAGTPPDLAVTVHAPRRSGDAAGVPAEESPLHGAIVVIGLLSALLIAGKRMRGSLSAVLVGMLVVSSMGLLIPVAAAEGAYVAYDLPVTIRNNGGSDAPAFDLTVYLDGERAAVMRIDEGIGAQGSLEVIVPIYTTPGRHTVRVVADERGTLRERNIADNTMERAYVFP